MSKAKTTSSASGIDARWLLIGVAMFSAIFTTFAMNSTHDQDNNASVAQGTIDVDNGDLKIKWERFTYHDIELSDNLSITSSGVYHLTGSLTDQNISVNTVDGKVKLILDNVTIKNSTGPAIACYAADDLVIELVGENVIEDGETYASSYDEDVAGAIYSKADLTFQGDGELQLIANYQDGIVGKDDLKFNSGIYEITAADDGIRGKDSVYIVDGDFVITAKADAIKSTNSSVDGKGFVLIEDGNFNINAAAKGVKAINSILIYGGDFLINSGDDAIHTNNYIGVSNGSFVINSGDDGIHADKKLIIDGGSIKINKSYEGLEAQAVIINDGEISVISFDDGINAGGGADGSANDRRGADPFAVDINCIVAISGGDIYINASGDGIDSNGYIDVSGGTVVIDGPTTNGNGALDSNGDIRQLGGTIIAVGASGMAESISSNSSVNNLSIYFTSTLPAGTKIKIKDATGTTIVSHTAAKSFSHLAVGTAKFELGETYTIYVDDAEYDEVTISDVTTTVGSSAGGQMPGGDMRENPSAGPGQPLRYDQLKP